MNFQYKNFTIIASVCFLAAAGCANNTSTYVSPLEYHQYSCNQLENELVRVGDRIKEISKDRTLKEVTSAAIVVGISVFLDSFVFWGGDSQLGSELRHLKGTVDAIEQTAIEKECHGLAAEIEKKREEAKRKMEEEQTTELIKK